MIMAMSDYHYIYLSGGKRLGFVRCRKDAIEAIIESPEAGFPLIKFELDAEDVGRLQKELNREWKKE